MKVWGRKGFTKVALFLMCVCIGLITYASPPRLEVRLHDGAVGNSSGSPSKQAPTPRRGDMAQPAAAADDIDRSLGRVEAQKALPRRKSRERVTRRDSQTSG